MNTGLYIHIPFCKSRCSYCDFATDVYRNNDAVERYVNALCKEISNTTFEISDSVDTLYFGGGTPSLLTARQLEKILDTIHKKFEFAEKISFTLEMNPGTVTLEKLLDFRKLGVNRASFGVQTFDDVALKLLARGHDSNDARTTFKLLRKAKFDNISFDLIGGLPNQNMANWEDNLNQALDLEPEHLSLYLLELEDSTPLAEQIRSKRQPKPDEELAAEMYELMLDKVAAKGYEQYEISNFSKPNFQSRHNNKYWNCDPVFGYGVSAHSFDGKTRWSNERDTNQYVSMVENSDSTIVASEDINLACEVSFLSLRMNRGLNLDEYQSRFGIDLHTKFAVEISRLTDLGLVLFENEHLKLTRKGMVFSNEVFSVFV
jgi:oxygen-independent coproporphyrinogen III oxidase